MVGDEHGAGRDTELDQLRQALERAGAGQGQVVAILGEPGVGKSRLVWELRRSHRTQGWLVLESSSVSYGRTTSHLPVVDLLKSYLQIEERDDPRRIREKLTGKLLALDEALRQTLPAFQALLELPAEDPGWQALDAPARRRVTREAVKRLLLRESQVQPLLVFEDLHWIDPDSQALLDALVESLPTARVLLLVNYRPEYQHGWGSKTYYSQLRLDPLPPETADGLLEALIGDDAGLAALKRRLVESTQGNPFFLEESVVPGGAGRVHRRHGLGRGGRGDRRGRRSPVQPRPGGVGAWNASPPEGRTGARDLRAGAWPGRRPHDGPHAPVPVRRGPTGSGIRPVRTPRRGAAAPRASPRAGGLPEPRGQPVTPAHVARRGPSARQRAGTGGGELATQAAALAEQYQERGHQAYARRLLGEVASLRQPSEPEPAVMTYRDALALAQELEMRPLEARCRLGLGTVLGRAGAREQGRVELGAAVEMLRSLGMPYWLARAETALGDLA